MNPNATHFKFTCYSYTRRATFQNRPTWLALSDKIHSLFDIPLNKVAVSYIDAEGDEVTLSTQEELEDFYRDLDSGGRWNPGEVIKVTVLDLSSARQDKSDKSLPTTPRSTANARNTFGANLSDGLPFNIDEDWPSLPPFSNVYVGSHGVQQPDGSLHAFIEVLESDAEVSVKKTPPSSGTSSVRTPTPRLDKGKGRALDVEEDEEDDYDEPAGEDDDVSSIVSVIDSQGMEKKPDIHVLGRRASSGLFEPTESRASYKSRTSRESRTSHRSSTPKSSVREIPPRSISNISLPPSSVLVPPSVSSNTPTEDPPLPDLDKLSLEREHANPSLSTDIAGLLTTLTEVISSHPELSEGVRKILENAVAGNYWTPAQRESFHEAAGSVAEGLTSLDQEAGRKVAEALGNLFRTVGQVVGTSPSPNVKSTTTPELVNTSTTTVPPKNGGLPSDTHPPYRVPSFDSWTRGSYGYGGYGYGGYGLYGPPPPGAVPPPGSFGPKPPPPRGLYPYRAPEGPPLHHSTNPSARSRPMRRNSRQSKDLRAQVEAAKLLYKAEKERYRLDREERRKEKEQRMIEMLGNRGDLSQEHEHTPLADTLTLNSTAVPPPLLPEPVPILPLPPQFPAAMSQVISNGNGRYPTLEMSRVPSAPHPTQTLRRVSEPVGRRVSEQISDPKEQSLKRIVKKLGDMGFTTRANPDLTSRVAALLPSDITTMTPDKEEDIATTLVNELLKSPRIPPVASGSSVIQ